MNKRIWLLIIGATIMFIIVLFFLEKQPEFEVISQEKLDDGTIIEELVFDYEKVYQLLDVLHYEFEEGVSLIVKNEQKEMYVIFQHPTTSYDNITSEIINNQLFIHFDSDDKVQQSENKIFKMSFHNKDFEFIKLFNNGEEDAFATIIM
ncbi:hypothetical protein P4U44_09950 [Alkalihalobacillus alcalophilus]|nr:hypothetical protein [Alkalihalobacillus alcalophilus]MED1562213.1 hypothetical protein [Alkalihalobacillus alcalophilus]